MTNIDLDALQACPFCRGTDIRVHAYGKTMDSEPDAFCQCQGCTTTGPNGKSEAGAITAWNRRAAAAAALPFAILPDELAALQRFHECAMDDEGYDVPKEMMRRLAGIGLLRRTSGAFYEHTTFGLAVLNGEFAIPERRADTAKSAQVTDK